MADGRFSLLDNNTDSAYIINASGALLNTASLRPVADAHLQNIDGVQVGNRLIISEDGDMHVVAVDLNSYAVSQFADLSALPDSWLGAIANDGSDYYITTPMRLYRFTEGGSPALIGTLADAPTGVVVQGGYAYSTINGADAVYQMNLSTGNATVLYSGLTYRAGCRIGPFCGDHVAPGHHRHLRQ